ncbi:hypothetical protein OTU49_004065 [Cherax quadricarinatus]|uniref:Uncharacterized protein n=1 Tax=Cherax quadricarinatus TaxID=27406 RepID=A0AAW0XFU6_CHEQU
MNVIIVYLGSQLTPAPSASLDDPVGAAAENDRDSTSDTAVMNTAERARDRSHSPLPEEGDDNSSQESDTKSTEEHIPPPEEHLKNACENPLEEVKPPSEDSSSEEEDETPPAGENAHEEGNLAETSKAVEAEAACEAAPSSHDPDSDLEAEYDNVVLVRDGKGGAEGAAPPLSTSRHSSSASSSAGSHSSRGTDPAHTDPTTQSPMSTSPTPPPSLEPTPAPAPVSAQTPAPNTTPVPATTTPVTSTTTTKPAPQPVAKNNYNTGGLNLNMSAAEMRAKLARKKKADPRNDSLDLRKKYEIIQNM